MDYLAYFQRFLLHRCLAEVRPFAEVVEGAHTYPLLSVQTPGRRTLLITSGFHGDETAGPLTLLNRFAEIVNHARSRNVGLRIYPCLNPSGFTDGTRYNRSGECPNNDFLRYEIAPDVWVEVLPRGQKFLRHEVFRGGPKETRALRTELEALPTPDAALDIHQDPWLEGSFAYAYTFGPRESFRTLVDASGRLIPIARNIEVDDDDGTRTDRDGLIEHHDGSVTDYFHRRGVHHAVALETTTRSALDDCHDVNLIWIRGLIDLAAAA